MIYMASSDIGHVSQRIPTIQPTFEICVAPNHSREFAAAAGHKGAQPATLLMAKAMALTGLDLLRSPELMAEVQKHLADSLASMTPAM